MAYVLSCQCIRSSVGFFLTVLLVHHYDVRVRPLSLGIVTLVDAKNITRQLEGKEGKEAVSQIACADRIIINKSDLLSDSNDGQGILISLT